MKRLTLSLMITTLAVLTAFAADWRPVVGTCYSIDQSRVRNHSSGHISVWAKRTMDSEEMKAAEETARRNGRTVDYRKYQHTLELTDINCEQESREVRSLVNYGSDGRIIDWRYFPKTTREPEESESNGDLLMRTACDYAFKQK